VDDARDGVVLRLGSDPDPQRTVGVDGAGEDGLALALALRGALARDGSFVDGALARHDDAVGRDAVARADGNHIAHREGLGLDLLQGTIALDEGGLGHQARQGPDAGPGPAGGNALEHFADEEEEHDHGRLLGCTDNRRADGGNAHQGLNGEGSPGKGRGHGPAGDRHQADGHGGGVEPGLVARQERGQSPRGGEGDAAEERQPSLCRAPPRSVLGPVVMMMPRLLGHGRDAVAEVADDLLDLFARALSGCP
jgi:hypothetical protein